MCEICRSYPCHRRCPNADEPPVAYECDYCGDSIFVGSEYYKYDGKCYHEDCFKEAAVELLVIDGATLREAEMEEPDYDN